MKNPLTALQLQHMREALNSLILSAGPDVLEALTVNCQTVRSGDTVTVYFRLGPEIKSTSEQEAMAALLKMTTTLFEKIPAPKGTIHKRTPSSAALPSRYETAKILRDAIREAMDKVGDKIYTTSLINGVKIDVIDFNVKVFDATDVDVRSLVQKERFRQIIRAQSTTNKYTFARDGQTVIVKRLKA